VVLLIERRKKGGGEKIELPLKKYAKLKSTRQTRCLHLAIFESKWESEASREAQKKVAKYIPMEAFVLISALKYEKGGTRLR